MGHACVGCTELRKDSSAGGEHLGARPPEANPTFMTLPTQSSVICNLFSQKGRQNLGLPLGSPVPACAPLTPNTPRLAGPSSPVWENVMSYDVAPGEAPS